MKLYLARHGEYNASDLQAPLSENGISDIQHLAQFLRGMEIPIADIFHSGKLRAQQTAEILATGFIGSGTVSARQGLNPNDDVSAFASEMIASEEDILCVGHLPFMSRLTSKLVVNDENKELVAFQPGTIICLEKIQQERWIINGVLSPNYTRGVYPTK